MSVNKCPWCGGKFGLIRHYHFRTGFCREQCRRKYQASWERKKLLRRLIFRPPSVWLETGNASTRSNLSASSPAGKLPLQH
jgi:hypothetical protein